MIEVITTIDEFERSAAEWQLKFPRKYRAERIRGLPSMRNTFDGLFRSNGEPPSPEIFSQAVWDGCKGVRDDLEEDVKARARRAHPSFVREAHFYLILKEKLEGVAEVFTSAELDMHYKTDFLISALNAPIEIRIHTYTDTQRAHHFAATETKQPLAYKPYNPVNGDVEEEAIILDLRLPIVRGIGKELENGLWLYNADHAEEVLEALKQIHADNGFDF